MEGEEFGTSWNILDPDFVQDLAEAEAGVIVQSMKVTPSQGMNKMKRMKNLHDIKLIKKLINFYDFAIFLLQCSL